MGAKWHNTDCSRFATYCLVYIVSCLLRFIYHYLCSCIEHMFKATVIQQILTEKISSKIPRTSCVEPFEK